MVILWTLEFLLQDLRWRCSESIQDHSQTAIWKRKKVRWKQGSDQTMQHKTLQDNHDTASDNHDDHDCESTWAKI